MKTELQKLKDKLWQLCREISFKRHGDICYTCGARELTGKNRQLGHFIPKSICSTELAYSLDNLRPQCGSCNIWKSGNWVMFEEHLIQDFGKKFVADLKKKNQQTKGKSYGTHWFKEKIAEYEELWKTLRPGE